MIRAFVISFVSGLILISIAHNYNQLSKSFDHCHQLVQEIHRKADYLKTL